MSNMDMIIQQYFKINRKLELLLHEISPIHASITKLILLQRETKKQILKLQSNSIINKGK